MAPRAHTQAGYSRGGQARTGSNLVVDQVVEGDDGADERRQIDHLQSSSHIRYSCARAPKRALGTGPAHLDYS
jgi:hypothetical protein